MKYKIISLSFVLLFSTIYADEEEKGFEISAGIGQYFYDDTRLDDASMGVLSLGYRFDENWQVEAIWGNPDTELNPGNADIDTDWGALRALYHFNQGDYFTPYVSAGVGNMDVFKGEEQLVLGLGVKGKASDSVFWRLEGNYHADVNDTSIIAMIGLRFGGSDSAPAPAKIVDSDADGVLDNIDVCPNSPANTMVDDTGCAIKADIDSDMDGILDSIDQCPETPAKALVDSSGCQKELLKDVSVNLQINFDSDQAIVKAEYFSEIERVAKFMSDYAGTSVVIEGHTDSRGKAAHNQNLSTMRAEAVAKVLTEQFAIVASRVEAKGYGEGNPIADNETADGRSANRRVVAVIKQQIKEKQWQ